MKRIFFLLMLVLLFPFCYANVPYPDALCVKGIMNSSDKFHFIKLGQKVIFDRMEQGDAFCASPVLNERKVIYYEENASRMRVTVDDREILNTELAAFKTTYSITMDSSEKLDVYWCGQDYELGLLTECPLAINLCKYGNDLSVYDNSVLKIYMDDILVREYVMKYLKDDGSPCPPKETEKAPPNYTPAIAVLLLALAAGVLLMKLKK